MEVIGFSIDLSWETTLKINSLSHPWSDFTTSITTAQRGPKNSLAHISPKKGERPSGGTKGSRQKRVKVDK